MTSHSWHTFPLFSLETAAVSNTHHFLLGFPPAPLTHDGFCWPWLRFQHTFSSLWCRLMQTMSALGVDVPAKYQGDAPARVGGREGPSILTRKAGARVDSSI